jgi:hypothetical protein
MCCKVGARIETPRHLLARFDLILLFDLFDPTSQVVQLQQELAAAEALGKQLEGEQSEAEARALAAEQVAQAASLAEEGLRAELAAKEEGACTLQVCVCVYVCVCATQGY